jgi:hypothetical protein
MSGTVGILDDECPAVHSEQQTRTKRLVEERLAEYLLR